MAVRNQVFESILNYPTLQQGVRTFYVNHMQERRSVARKAASYQLRRSELPPFNTTTNSSKRQGRMRILVRSNPTRNPASVKSSENVTDVPAKVNTGG